MSFVTGLLVIDAPASALNNLGKIEGAMTDNATGVKYIRTKEGAYPYVSAQAFRYWLRATLESGPWGWKAAPIYREQKVAYTDANPIRWWDDDLLGYMRAPSKKASAVEARESDASRSGETTTTETVTRVSPFRVSTLVSIAPVNLVNDFGVMARHEGDPVPYEHQFYRTTLKGLFSLDLGASGTFTYKDKSGYLNLDEPRIQEAKARGLESLPNSKAYRLPDAERIQRVSALLSAISELSGGAKQALHYTDVSPDIVLAAVTRGGNHVFGHIVTADAKGLPRLNLEGFREAVTIPGDGLLSRVYVGWVQGYLDDERATFEEALKQDSVLSSWRDCVIVGHPKEVLAELVNDMKQHPEWLQ